MNDAQRSCRMIDGPGNRMTIVARMGDKDDDSALIRAQILPDAGAPLHSHVDQECFYILEGELEIFLLNDLPGWRVVKAGERLFIESNVKHAVRNASGKIADVMVITENRLIRFLEELGAPANLDAPIPGPTEMLPDPTRFQKAVQWSGYWFASPEESEEVLSRAEVLDR